MKASTGSRTQASSRTAGTSTARTGCHAQWAVRRASRSNGSDGSGGSADAAVSGQGAPISTQRASAAIRSSGSAPVGGMSNGRPCSRCTSALSPGRPGTIAGPLSPPASSPVRLSSRNPPNPVPAAWHPKQFSASSGRISFSKNSTCTEVGVPSCADTVAAGTTPPMVNRRHANGAPSLAVMLRFRLRPSGHRLAARGESPTAFDRRCIPPGGVAPRSQMPQFAPSSRLASRAHRQSRCNAGFHHGLLGALQCNLPSVAPVRKRGGAQPRPEQAAA